MGLWVGATVELFPSNPGKSERHVDANVWSDSN